MDRQTALTLLSAHKPQLQSQFGVRSLALFGSTEHTIDLPDRITGELNPNNDLFALAKELLT